MDVLVAYDVSTETAAGRRRLRRVANTCVAFGQRAQKSVFECSLTDSQLLLLERRLEEIIDVEEDSLRIYRLAGAAASSVTAYGRSAVVDPNKPLIY